MAKVEINQTPRNLNPYGEKILRIWYDDNSEPPKNYIWCKDEEYNYWNGVKWVPWEADEVFGRKRHHHNDCDFCCDKEIDIKLEKFKKDVLASVLKLVKAQNPESASTLAARIAILETNVATLMQINHNLFVKNTELEALLNSLGYAKLSDVGDLEQLSDIEDRLTAAERNIDANTSNIATNTSNIANNSSTIANHTNRIAALESSSSNNYNSRISALENAGFITSAALDGYARQSYVDTAIDNANIPRNVSQLNNDSGYITLNDLPTPAEAYDDTELRSRITDIENAGYITSEDLPEHPDYSETITN